MSAQAQISTALAVSAGGDTKELAFLRTADAALAGVRTQHPDWYADYEDIDPFVADRELVEHLLQTAPDDLTKGLIMGMLLIRQQIAAVTGRGF
jgi:hypothetical protein